MGNADSASIYTGDVDNDDDAGAEIAVGKPDTSSMPSPLGSSSGGDGVEELPIPDPTPTIAIVGIVGAIGAGKSKALEVLRRTGMGDDVEVVVVDEGFEEDTPAAAKARAALAAFYQGKLAVFQFQVLMLDRQVETFGRAVMQALDVVENTGRDVVAVVERTPWCGEFVFMRANEASPIEQDIFSALVKRFTWRPDAIMHVQASVETCVRRQQERARAAEDGVAEAYLASVARHYTDSFASGEWAARMGTRPILKVDNDTDDDTTFGARLATEMHMARRLGARPAAFWRARQAAVHDVLYHMCT
jgi:deoxyadenosine/deoxycytidine kinase